MKTKFKLNYIVIPAIAVAVMLVGGYATGIGLSGWYQTLELPSITPDGQVIGTIWTIIYTLITISVLIYVNGKKTKKDKERKTILLLFAINAALNVLWSFVFFVLRSLDGAVYEMIALEITTILLIIYLWRRSLYSSLLLFPYAAWVAFATYIAIQTLLLNG